MKKSYGLLVLAFGALLGLGAAVSSFFIVSETEQAIVLEFGRTIRTIKDPGLHMKTPFIQNVIVYEKRLLDIDPPKGEMILADKKRLDVDTYARYRIVDPLLFYQSLNNEHNARGRLVDLLNSNVREVLGKVSLQRLLSEERREIMEKIQTQANLVSIPKFGIEIVDARINRADFPPQTSQAIYMRMRSEREREAKEFRAQGEEESQKLKATAEKDKTVLLAEARKKADILKGEGERKATQLWADAARQNPSFFAFYRSMEAYKKSFQPDNTTMVLSTDSEFFKEMKR